MKEVILEHARICCFDEGIIECFPFLEVEIIAKHAHALKKLIDELSSESIGFIGHWGGQYSHSVNTDAIQIISTIPQICQFAVVNHDEISRRTAEISVRQTRHFTKERGTEYFTDRDEAFFWLSKQVKTARELKKLLQK